jgi:hypothetical protein
LWKHRQKCDGTNEIAEMKDKIVSLENTVSKLTTLLEQQKCLPNNSNLTNTNSNNLTNTNSNNTTLTNNTQKIINVYNYVSSNFNEAQPIRMLEKQDIDKLLTVDQNIKHTIEELLIFNQSKYNLDKFLGEIIINAYKKEDPEEQQFWASNVQKLTFIVRQILNKREKTWLHDKKGTCLTKYIVDPILKEIKKLLQRYVKENSENIQKSTFEEMEKIQNNGMIAVNIIYEINEKELHKKILKYIAPHFQLEQTNLLLMN